MATSQRLSARALAAQLPALQAPRYRSLAIAIAALLADGRVTPGTALPSERDLAAALGVSRSMTTAAYQQLADDGRLVRRQGSGSFLRMPSGMQLVNSGGRFYHGGAEVIDLSVAAFPAVPGVLEAAAAQAVRRLPECTGDVGYQPYGITQLRELIAHRYAERGVPTSVDQIMLTNGAQHALDLVLRLTLNSGERVLTELPTYPGALDAIRAHGGRILGVPFAPGGGWDIATMTSTLAQTSPRLALLVPDFHNPTGALIATEQRQAVLDAARRAGTTVVIDESLAELRLPEPGSSAERPASMAALDPAVYSIGSLSKPVWGGLRIGWIRADADTVSKLAVLRAQAGMSGSVFDQLMACELLADFEPILALRCAQLRTRRDALLAALTQQLPQWQPTRPVGGLSTWVRLDAPAATALTFLLEQRGILITPGSRFSVDGGLERYLRIPYALPADTLVGAVAAIAQAWAELDSHRVRRPDSSVLVPT